MEKDPTRYVSEHLVLHVTTGTNKNNTLGTIDYTSFKRMEL